MQSALKLRHLLATGELVEENSFIGLRLPAEEPMDRSTGECLPSDEVTWDKVSDSKGASHETSWRFHRMFHCCGTSEGA